MCIKQQHLGPLVFRRKEKRLNQKQLGSSQRWPLCREKVWALPSCGVCQLVWGKHCGGWERTSWSTESPMWRSKALIPHAVKHTFMESISCHVRGRLINLTGKPGWYDTELGAQRELLCRWAVLTRSSGRSSWANLRAGPAGKCA